MRIAWLAFLLVGCASDRAIAVRVRDPRLVAVDRIDAEGRASRVLSPRADARLGCPWRDERGFPHFCERGEIATEDDGTIVVRGEVHDDGRDVRVRFATYAMRTCRRARRHGCWAKGAMDLVTPRENVTWIGEPRATTREVPSDVGRD